MLLMQGIKVCMEYHRSNSRDNTIRAYEYMLGRLSVNPLKHIDPMGTVVVPLVMYFLGGMVFGWAKPVPVSFRNLRNPKRDMVLVAAAGPAAKPALWRAVGSQARWAASDVEARIRRGSSRRSAAIPAG